MSTVLSTKILTPSQRALLSGHRLIECDFIRVTHYPPSDFEGLVVAGIPAVFSSQNAVRAAAPLITSRPSDFKRVFCVGERTALSLTAHDLHPDLIALNSKALAMEIAKVEGLDSLNYFCGRLRRPDLPAVLTASNIRVFEVAVYQTVRTPQRIDTPFDVVLFYSPSGVKSFLERNRISERQTAIAIGHTTAAYLACFHRNTVVAEQPEVAYVLLKAADILS
ncbi:MAG: uroporphyrinogen-III synthase [Flavobacteriales bacterium]